MRRASASQSSPMQRAWGAYGADDDGGGGGDDDDD